LIKNTTDGVFFCLIVAISISILVFCVSNEFPVMRVSGLESSAQNSTKTPINHIIVISQGKRSFDNYFGEYPGANGLPNNLSVPLNPFTPPLSKFTVATWFKTNETFMSNAYLVNKGGIGLDSSGYNMNYGIWMNRSGYIVAGF
jgi:hypothetical protein